MNQESKANINYFEIVKKAFIFPWKYRFLFWLGVLAVFASGGGGGGNFNFSGGSGNWQNLFNNQDGKSSFFNSVKSGMPRVLGESTSSFESWISTHWFWLALIILILVIIFFILLIFGIMARAGIIKSVVKLEKKETSDFWQAMKEGKRFFWRLVGQFFLVFIFMLLLIGVLAGISVPLFMLNVILGFVWLFPAILIFIVAVIYVGLVVQFWTQMFVVENKRMIETLRPAIKFVNSRFKEVIIFWLISIVIGLVYFVAVAMVMFILLMPFVLLAIGIGLANLIAGIILGVVGLLILSLVILVISGYYTAGISSYWTLAYLELRKTRNHND